jgi:hypothetical protein
MLPNDSKQRGLKSTNTEQTFESVASASEERASVAQVEGFIASLHQHEEERANKRELEKMLCSKAQGFHRSCGVGPSSAFQGEGAKAGVPRNGVGMFD